MGPLLGIQFSQSNRDLEIYTPDGQRFLSSIEINQKMIQQEQRANALDEKIRSAVINLLGLGLSVEQVSVALSISVEAVLDITTQQESKSRNPPLTVSKYKKRLRGDKRGI